jgi:hypothetical protein
VINALPEWRIANPAVLPIVTFWAVNNIIVFFLTCMMTLQAPVRRNEERFELDEPTWIFSAAGALSTGRVRDMSLSGVAIMADPERALATQCGERVRVFVSEVGFVPGNVVRQSGRFLAVKFEPLAAVEHDLLIRKLFTSGFDTAGVRVSTWSATTAMLRSIWSTRAELPAAAAPAPDTLPTQSANPVEKLPLASLVEPPQVRTDKINALVERRRALAA